MRVYFIRGDMLCIRHAITQRRVPLMSLPSYDALDPCSAGTLVSPLRHGSDELINYLGVSSSRCSVGRSITVRHKIETITDFENCIALYGSFQMTRVT